MLNFFKHIGCLFGIHEWTTDFIERGNVPPATVTQASTVDEVLAAFEADNIMYCKHCHELCSIHKTSSGRSFSRELKD